MDIISLLKEKIEEENISVNEDMSKHTSFKTGGKADFFIRVKNLEELKFVLEVSKYNNIPIYILGNGSNILVKDEGIRGIVCKIEIEKFEVYKDGEDVFVTLRKWK